MKLTEVKNEDALDMLAEILEPTSEIFTDQELRKMYEDGESRIALVKYAIKNHKQAIISILATLDGVPVEEYKCNVLTLPMKLIELLNNEDLASFFH